MAIVVAWLLLAAVLASAVLLKLSDPAGTRAALATYGVRGARATAIAWAGIIGVEATLAAGVAAGSRAAAVAAALLLLALAGLQGALLLRGRAGAPCACFGARGRLSRGSVVRTALLAAACAGLAGLPRRALSAHEWLGVGLAAALAASAALAVLVLALAREVGVLRMAVRPQGALEVPEEGPELGGRSDLVRRFTAPLAPGRVALAVFTSEGCGLCRALAPTIAAFARDRRVAVQTFDEVRDAQAWAESGVPGSPFAVALDANGTVLAKGTFNTGAQLDSVVATAVRRRAGTAVA
jgi:hypothetical protein